MNLTYILVDFENVQPTDMGLLRGDQYRLILFRGPHQNKLDFETVESLQPLGERVSHVQSDKQGKNALDLHIAFYMGRFLQELEASGSPVSKAARFVVISHDGGFDALIDHVQSLGYGAMKAASIRQALGLDVAVAETGSALQPMSASNVGFATPSSVVQISSNPPAVKKAAPVAHAQPTKLAAPPKKTATAQASPTKAAEKKPQAPARKNIGAEDKEKVLENLRLHPKKRPVKRQTLENHIMSLLGGSVTAKAVRGLVAGLENEGVIKFSENKIDEYKIPKRKK